jgi:hypothetical protein
VNVSGKLVIIGILAISLTGAGVSWWYRYSATHRAAEFWGPKGSRLIRDAPIVEFYEFERSSQDPIAMLADTDLDVEPKRQMAGAEVSRVVSRIDVSRARGMTHLRNALLESRSFDWSADPPNDIDWGSMLSFRQRNSNEALKIMFSPDFRWASASPRGTIDVISCRPIGDGLVKMLGQFTAESPTAR